MATITYHHSEDSAATVEGAHRTLLVVYIDGKGEILERPARHNGMVVSDGWVSVGMISTYGAAIDHAARLADRR